MVQGPRTCTDCGRTCPPLAEHRIVHRPSADPLDRERLEVLQEPPPVLRVLRCMLPYKGIVGRVPVSGLSSAMASPRPAQKDIVGTTTGFADQGTDGSASSATEGCWPAAAFRHQRSTAVDAWDVPPEPTGAVPRSTSCGSDRSDVFLPRTPGCSVGPILHVLRRPVTVVTTEAFMRWTACIPLSGVPVRPPSARVTHRAERSATVQTTRRFPTRTTHHRRLVRRTLPLQTPRMWKSSVAVSSKP